MRVSDSHTCDVSSMVMGQITLLNNTGQNTASVYSGTYTSTTNLSITDFDRIGVWKGMWIVTATL